MTKDKNYNYTIFGNNKEANKDIFSIEAYISSFL